MNAQTAARPTSAPQTPSLPQAKPETIGLSTVRLQRMSDAFKREVDKGTLPGATVMVARRGQIGWFDAIGRQNPAASAPMAHDSLFRIFSMTKPIVSVGIMMLVEDGHFVLGDPVAKVHSGVCRPEGRRREQRQARPRPGEAADDRAGSAAAHLGPDLRPHRQRPGPAALSAVAAAQPQDHQRRARDHDRRHAADLPAGRGMELQPLD